MKTVLLVLLLAVAAAWHCHGQGSVGVFNNNTSRVYYVTAYGTNALVPAGSQFRGELLYAPNGTPPESFNSVAVRAGTFTFSQPGLFNLGGRTIAGITPAGGVALFQVRVWDTTYGATYEEAAAFPPCMVGHSEILTVDTGDPTTTPPGTPTPLPSAGLKSFVVGEKGCPITFADPNLEQAIRSALNFPPEGITTRNILLLSNLNACCLGIADIAGLEHARRLEHLDLSVNALTSLNFPASLSNLITLKLNGNLMTSLAFAGVLPRLRSLNLAENELSDFATLVNLPALAALNLQLNNLTTVSLPPSLPALVSLDLGYNQVRDFAFLAPYPELNELFIDDNGLRTVELPASLSNLMTLTISINRITNFWFLTNHPYMTLLDISANFLPAIELPPNLPFMSWINLSQNRLREFKAPSGWTGLATLHLGDSLLTNVCVEGLPNLYQLNVSRNQLTNLFIPPGLALLEVIDVRFTPIASVVLPEDLAAGNLADFVAAMQSQGVQIQTFPETLRLSHPAVVGGFFQFTVHSPPGSVRLWASPNLSEWTIHEETPKGLHPLALQLPRSSPAHFYRVERLAICP